MCLLKWAKLIAAVCLITLSGCSHTPSPVESAIGENAHPVVAREGNQHGLLGLYTFVCRPEIGTVDVIPLRDADLHLNALKFLEPPPFVYLTIEGPPHFNGNILNVDIGLRHPFLGQDIYTGFDVCGIVFTHGSVTGFSDPDIVMAGEGDTRLLNADGYTRWWNPAEFPHGHTVFNYIDGLFGNPADAVDFNCTVNGYKYFADGLGKNESLTVLTPGQRGVFSAGAKNIRHYTIGLSGEPDFNYAVDACWKKPSVIPPQNIPDDFTPEANRPEAWRISVTELENSLYCEDALGYAGGNLNILIDVYDHFNADLNEVYAESLSGLPLTAALSPVGGGQGYSTYMLDFTGVQLTHDGEADLLITVKSETSGYGDLLPGKSLCSYFKYVFNIRKPVGWVRTWGGDTGWEDHGKGVAVDNEGHIYVTGCFDGTVDFDTGPGIDEHISNGYKDAFLSKFDQSGNFLWALTWGGHSSDEGKDVKLDANGNIYVAGDFMGTVDFDPGPGVDEHTVVEGGSFAHTDFFLAKFDADGNYIWGRTWGGEDIDACIWIETDPSCNVFVTGSYQLTIDFDPGPELAECTSNGFEDIFLSKFTPDGEFLWVRTWGSTGQDSWHPSVALCATGDCYVAGGYINPVDFDPGPDVVQKVPNGHWDAYFSKFDADGNFLSVTTWGGEGSDHAWVISVDNSDCIYVTGGYADTVDFDPGPGIAEHTAEDNRDPYLCKFYPDGTFNWVRVWGGSFGDDVSNNGTDRVFVLGDFSGTVDLDPGPGIDEHTVDGSDGHYLVSFDSNGLFKWGRSWDGFWGYFRNYVASDHAGNSFIAGSFQDEVDFDPGPGVYERISNVGDDVFVLRMPPDGNF